MQIDATLEENNVFSVFMWFKNGVKIQWNLFAINISELVKILRHLCYSSNSKYYSSQSMWS